MNWEETLGTLERIPSGFLRPLVSSTVEMLIHRREAAFAPSMLLGLSFWHQVLSSCCWLFEQAVQAFLVWHLVQ